MTEHRVGGRIERRSSGMWRWLRLRASDRVFQRGMCCDGFGDQQVQVRRIRSVRRRRPAVGAAISAHKLIVG
eukprot:1163495-Pleurochrysis_carterae.AAC.1